ncbi:lipoyl synthase [Acetobacteroides hydrogenigenes]|uniref:lipoyl synthase n=1 Tax=Acetobacteroides hydrogenigenes TaxID=979970 RepID=UPI0021CE8F37|nr:lipoyl synthase [Acetobacteroides hydrogenigenes]
MFFAYFATLKSSNLEKRQQRLKKPEWLKIKLTEGENYASTSETVKAHNLHTICSSGRCPNIGECWGKGTATFMVLGEICTRSCKFCATHSGRPLPVDREEPSRVAQSVRLMGVKYCVITSVDRDDLPDGGAEHWAAVISEVKRVNPSTAVEILIPDFDGRGDLIDTVLAANPDVVGHNLETIKRLTPSVRSRAQYDVSLKTLKHIADRGAVAKSSLMLGLGETEDEILEAMDDMLAAGCRLLTLGQYLQPTHKHLPVQAYIHPDKFTELKEIALRKGFKYVESGPLVRSSYMAERAYEGMINPLNLP